ncbi:MAG TPA: MaoC/PaaZ C-terminal domain-containing protein [Candidatus Hydrogenedentes bacterium]|nr:MaoC/PaaZ C-terminal domain-containing protein [Candidatus Hydrogenedentota bacterium]
MEVASHYVGRRCTPLDIEITPRMGMNFAAGTGDLNPCYFDDERPGGIIAPPMLATALTWRISSRLTEFWESGDFPAEVIARQVHFSEILQWHKPVRPGERLRLEGITKAILPHRGGTHLILEYQAWDTANELVFTEYTGALLRGVRCSDGGKGGDTLPPAPVPPTAPELLWENVLHIGPMESHIYDGCADIHFPIHSSPAFAHAVGLPSIIYQGTATLSLALREIVNMEAGRDPERLCGAGNIFAGMVRMNSDIRVQALAKTKSAGTTCVHFAVLNMEGKHAIKNAWALIRD